MNQVENGYKVELFHVIVVIVHILFYCSCLYQSASGTSGSYAFKELPQNDADVDTKKKPHTELHDAPHRGGAKSGGGTKPGGGAKSGAGATNGGGAGGGTEKKQTKKAKKSAALDDLKREVEMVCLSTN